MVATAAVHAQEAIEETWDWSAGEVFVHALGFPDTGHARNCSDRPFTGELHISSKRPLSIVSLPERKRIDPRQQFLLRSIGRTAPAAFIAARLR
jgi:hypothetical protein